MEAKQVNEMPPEEVRRVFPGFRHDLPGGRRICVFRITDDVGKELGRDAGSFVIVTERPALPEDEAEWSRHVADLAAMRDGDAWMQELHLSAAATRGLFSILMQHLYPEWAKVVQEATEQLTASPWTCRLNEFEMGLWEWELANADGYTVLASTKFFHTKGEAEANWQTVQNAIFNASVEG